MKVRCLNDRGHLRSSIVLTKIVDPSCIFPGYFCESTEILTAMPGLTRKLDHRYFETQTWSVNHSNYFPILLRISLLLYRANLRLLSIDRRIVDGHNCDTWSPAGETQCP
jgi:hypothetical protein